MKMDWKKWLGYDLYKKLWSIIGKRPWTYIRRDFWHQFEIINIVFFVSAGFFSGLYFDSIILWVVSNLPWSLIGLAATFYVIGGLQCHFFWGSKYIPGQKGEIRSRQWL